MNKYKKAYENIVDACGSIKTHDDLMLLSDLVKKEMPVKPRFFQEEWGNDAICPNCKEVLEGEEPYRCCNCGQRISWEFDDE